MSDDIFIPLLFIWGISAFVAGIIASDRGRSFLGFAAATFFFLGPLGVGFALVATHGLIEKRQLLAAREAGVPAVQPTKRKVADGRQRFNCPRCGAENDILNADTSYDCWRCAEH